MPSSDQPLFVWACHQGSREFIIDIFPNGKCVFFDESIRRQLCHTGKDPRQILLEEIAADSPSLEQARKAEFGIEFTIDKDHLCLIQKVRQEFDQTNDVSSILADEVNRRFLPILHTMVYPYLTEPISEEM